MFFIVNDIYNKTNKLKTLKLWHAIKQLEEYLQTDFVYTLKQTTNTIKMQLHLILWQSL